MKNSLKFISIGLVMVVLLMSQWANNEPVAEAVVVSNNTVEFMDTSAATVSYYTPGALGTSTVKFWINDADLQTTKSASTTWWLDHNVAGAATSSDVDAQSTFALHTGTTTNSYDTNDPAGLTMSCDGGAAGNRADGACIWGYGGWAIATSSSSTYLPISRRKRTMPPSQGRYSSNSCAIRLPTPGTNIISSSLAVLRLIGTNSFTRTSARC